MKNLKRSHFTGFLSFLMLLSIGSGMLFISWRRWADISIDFGVELYIPWQLSKGKILCHDVMQFYGPLSQYINAAIFKIFGPGLMKLAFFNIFLIAVLTYIIYNLFLRLTNNLVAVINSAVFLSIFAFGQYVSTANYNYVCPYSHELTHGILLSFFSILLFIIYINKRVLSVLFFIGINLGLIFLTKLEVFFAASSSLISGLALFMALSKMPKTEIIRTLFVFFSGFILPTVIFLAYFSSHMPATEAMNGIMMQYKAVSNSILATQKFIKWNLGLDDPVNNFKKLLSIGSIYIRLLFISSLFCFLTGSIKTRNVRAVMKLLIVAALISISPFIIKKTPWMEMARPFPLFSALYCAGVLALIIKLRNTGKAVTFLPYFVYGAFAFTMLLKMILNARIWHYGFALALPAALLLVMLILYQIPNYLGKLFGGKNFIRTLGLIFVMLGIIAHVKTSMALYSLKTYPFGSGSDTIITWDPKFSSVGVHGNIFLGKINEIMNKNETFVAFPEGILYNYLARRDNPTPYYDFKPPAMDVWGEVYFKSLKAAHPDYIVLIDRDTSDCGPRYFGKDYGFEIFSWIVSDYRVIYQIGAPLNGNGFGMALAKKNSNGN